MADFASSNPTLKKDIAPFRAATSDEAKKFGAVFFLLDYAGVGNTIDYRFEDTLAGDFTVKGIDNYRRNWWCGGKPDESLMPGNGAWLTIDSKSERENVLLRFFSAEEIAQATKENFKIQSTMAPNYLSSVVIDYALQHSQDQRVSRALHRTVVSTRVPMCADKETTEYSKRAFQLLHNNYPNNYWTNETPYWY
ncbi:hypothetical protein HY949_05580 [Candidatus Gottesmanbacteria bacterium]|nr:hypothetical protein [Candidatus Gottesmanbacteria bacterium]